MRPDQVARLRAVQEKLADVFLSEADPDEWPEDATDRYRSKRAATETGTLLTRVIVLATAQRAEQPPRPENDPERDIARFEQQAAAVLERAAARKA